MEYQSMLLRMTTHLPARKDCHVCWLAKQRRRQARKVKECDKHPAKKFGEKTSFDYLESNKNHDKDSERGLGVGAVKVGFVAKNEASGFATYGSCKTHSADEAVDHLRAHFGKEICPKRVCCTLTPPPHSRKQLNYCVCRTVPRRRLFPPAMLSLNVLWNL
jgi:hypothetical protein